MVVVTVGLVVVQEMCARLGAYTGEGLAALIREQFSLRVTAVALACLLVANLGLVVSEFAGIAAALELVGVSRYVSVPLAAVVLFVLVMFGSYRYAERIFLVMSLAFLAYPVAAVLSHPAVGTATADLLVPHFREAKLFLGLITGQVFIGAAIALLPGNLIRLLVQAQILNGVVTPVLLGYILVLANRRTVLGEAVNGPVFRVVATGTVVVTGALSVVVLGQSVLSLLGIS